MWTHLDLASALLIDVFSPLVDCAKNYDRPWSIAELRIPNEDVSWLRSWFGQIPVHKISAWIDAETLEGTSDHLRIPENKMLCSLLVCIAAEICRREGTEGSVWPIICSILPKSDELRRHLFMTDGQPSTVLRNGIADAVRILNLRNVMDIEGTQQWFISMKLQFGFTYRGAKRSLSKWLVGLGQPHAVQYLLDDPDLPELASSSFQTLWSSLLQYRRGFMSDEDIRDKLRESPWIQPEWIDDILKESQSRLDTLGLGERVEPLPSIMESEAVEEDVQAVSDVFLEWPHGKPPRIRLALAKQDISGAIGATGASEIDFSVDGSRVCRWLLQEDGAWSGPSNVFAEPDISALEPNLTPRVLTIETREGKYVMEWDLGDLGICEDVLVFDLKSGQLVDSSSSLHPDSPYAILCDRKCEIEGGIPVEVFLKDGLPKQAIRLAPPLGDNLRVLYDGFVLWEASKREPSGTQVSPLTLTIDNISYLKLGDRAQLVLNDVPHDAEGVTLLIHRRRYILHQSSGVWQTNMPIELSPSLSARQRRVWACVTANGKKHYQKPQLSLNLLGAAMLRFSHAEEKASMRFDVLSEGSEVNKGEGTSLIRFWAPFPCEKAVVLEGKHRVGTLTYGKLRLRDLSGHGGTLQLVCGPDRYDLGIKCTNRGSVQRFVPPMVGCSAQLSLLSAKDPADFNNEGYGICAWVVQKNGKAKLNHLLRDDILATSGNRVWKLSRIDRPLSVALAYKGAWVGAWWDLELIRNYMVDRTEFRSSDFALMKWLRIPVLHDDISSEFGDMVRKSPSRFIEAWLGDVGIPDCLLPHDHDIGLDSVVRAFLWSDFPASHLGSTLEAVKRISGNGLRDSGDWCRLLRFLLTVSPVLCWKGLEQVILRKPDLLIEVLNLLVNSTLGLPMGSDEGHLRYRLDSKLKRTSIATGITETDIEEAASSLLSLLHNRVWHIPDALEDQLGMMGETIAGRDYLTVRFGTYLLEKGMAR